MSQKNSWHETFMQIAELIAERHSTCARIKVGALLVKDGRIISTGYNGTPAKSKHECCTYFPAMWAKKTPGVNDKFFDAWKLDEWLSSAEFKDLHRQFSIDYEIHAEMNCIAYAARQGMHIDGSTLYCTFSPCINCAKLIIASGIKEFYYRHLYERKDDDGRTLLQENKIECYEIK